MTDSIVTDDTAPSAAPSIEQSAPAEVSQAAPLAEAVLESSPSTPAAEEAPKGNDWAALREKYAKGDEKIAKRLARYSSHEAVLDALLAAQNKIASGAIKPALPENHTPEELAAWRESNGIPASPDEYELSLPDDIELTEEDQSQLSELVTAAHEQNMTPAQVNAIVNKLVTKQQALAEVQVAKDHNFKLESQEVLRDEWGSEYKTNINLINGFLNTAPEGTRDLLLAARLTDGSILGNHPQVLRWLANTARELNPLATVVPATTANAPQAVEAELNNIKSLMGDLESKYWKGPEAKQLQARYRQLIEAKTLHGSR